MEQYSSLGTLSVPEQAAGVYEGYIRSIDEHYIVQQTDRWFICHDSLLLTASVEVGANVQIVYKDGYGTPQIIA